jgi:hypothetical protein
MLAQLFHAQLFDLGIAGFFTACAQEKGGQHENYCAKQSAEHGPVNGKKCKEKEEEERNAPTQQEEDNQPIAFLGCDMGDMTGGLGFDVVVSCVDVFTENGCGVLP